MHRQKAIKVTLAQVSSFYQNNQPKYVQASQEAIHLGKSNDAKKLFRVLCYHVLGSRVDWDRAVAAVNYLDGKGVLWAGDLGSLKNELQSCHYRFHQRGACFIYENRQNLCHAGPGGIVDLVRILEVLCNQDPLLGRNILAAQNKDTEIQMGKSNIGTANLHIPGLGMKWASHFLRDLGFSYNQLAILDSHIMEYLVCFGLVSSVPESLAPRAYLDIENKMKQWARNNLGNIPLDHLDWVLWDMSKSTRGMCQIGATSG